MSAACPDLRPDAAALAAELAPLPAPQAVAHLAARFRGRIALVSSFGAESAVLLHMAAAADPALPVLFLDTGKLFPETLAYRDTLIRRLGLRDVRSLRPGPAALAARDPLGGLWGFAPDACCALRKVAPLAAALAPFTLWLNGRKRAHGGDRATLPLVEVVEGKLKANPLAAWDAAALAAYQARHALPPHPLVAEGYASIGCRPCTTRTEAGESPRAGRWRGTGKTECGIHLPSPTTPLTGSH
ncbi:phosphoadenylyl-sulfate reductase [Siccirubricoccus phaeus]|uniref:phosphoadenylyl-sulfate reductase n=1 Tax=Siccirubricoccus phaeus TaxID=2595053 RepID=UPI0011F27BEB|nr:phosphoadenylyl-sulfate reductase [Siccirubricoccus phaeus]